jgi:hypothetical protein
MSKRLAMHQQASSGTSPMLGVRRAQELENPNEPLAMSLVKSPKYARH